MFIDILLYKGYLIKIEKTFWERNLSREKELYIGYIMKRITKELVIMRRLHHEEREHSDGKGKDEKRNWT